MHSDAEISLLSDFLILSNEYSLNTPIYAPKHKKEQGPIAYTKLLHAYKGLVVRILS